ncbi:MULTISPECIES: SDR family NAD(P)-dependent oxidoreductase [unclassified Acidisoma]|jgi:NAD(P)-dependent dehydrogenase (short-subunit alcohol dehydrogenase family)|uniref:SDR family NAD(P)-dependent oxidoreductase n=1 Tax=unclassified Acidisoma TaxID=2634065 RepID=UPI00131B10FC|nr:MULTISPECIES: SDR family oxidoreductase [unclassified Acidisoma]
MTETRILENFFSLSGKVAMVTGAAGGLGRAIAAAYLQAGAKVVLADLKEGELQSAAEELGALGDVFPVAVDVTKAAAVEEAVSSAHAHFKRLDILVTAAGIARRKAAEELPPEEFDFVMDVNVKGTLFCAQSVGRHMIAQGGGRIITIGSVRGLVGHPLGYVAYGVSKGAVHLLTRQLATEWAKHSINVNCIAPSVLKTPLADFILKTPEVRDLFMSRIPFNRAAEPEELSGTAIFLASPAASFITGQILFVDGGSVAG